MRRAAPDTVDTVRALIASISEPRLRELVVEAILAALAGLAASLGPCAAPTPRPGNGRRRARAAMAPARRATANARGRTRRHAAKAGAAANGRRRRGPRAKAEAAAGNGDASPADDVTPARLWEHAAKLEPKAPWRAIVREFGVPEAFAQAAQRDGTLPCSPRAAARFMTL